MAAFSRSSHRCRETRRAQQAGIDISFLPDGLLGQLPLPARIGATRTGGIDLNKPRIRAALAAALALAAAPHGFTVAEFTAKVHAMTGTSSAAYSIRQAGYDLCKIRGKQLLDKPARPAVTTSGHSPHAPSPPCSPCATRSSPPSSPVFAVPGWAANPRTGPASTATTNESASTCNPSSTTSPSKYR